MNAQDRFNETISSVSGALSSETTKTHALLMENEAQNSIARLLRRGVYIVGFNALEGFLRERTGELLAEASLSTGKFSDLPPRLQEASIRAALTNATTRARHEKGASAFPMLQEVAAAVASTTSETEWTLHKYSFLHAGSNVKPDEVQKVFAALGLADPWKQLDAIQAKVAVGGMPLRELYNTSLQKRHAAAHEPTANIEVSDLENLLRFVRVLACSYDLLLKTALAEIRAGAPCSKASKREVVPLILVKIVRERSDGYAELRSDGRARKLFKTESEAVRDIKNQKRDWEIVIVGADRTPRRWCGS